MNAALSSPGAGGAGTANSISGSSVTYAVGGAGAYYSANTVGTAGTANRGNGGGGAGGDTNLGANGGSGAVILSIPEGNTATFSGGVSQTSTTSGGNRIYTITAAGVSDTVTFA